MYVQYVCYHSSDNGDELKQWTVQYTNTKVPRQNSLLSGSKRELYGPKIQISFRKKGHIKIVSNRKRFL